MNSLLKNGPIQATPNLDDYFVSFSEELMKLDLSQAELLYKKLKFLGLNFDPFSNENSNECTQILENLELTIHLQNPYLATNILLKLLDLTEERINNLKQ